MIDGGFLNASKPIQGTTNLAEQGLTAAPELTLANANPAR
jgi:hypothetical protein